MSLLVSRFMPWRPRFSARFSARCPSPGSPPGAGPDRAEGWNFERLVKYSGASRRSESLDA